MDQNEVTKKLEVYQEAFKLFNGIQDNAAELLMECQMNYTVFLDNHPEFKPCFAYAGATMFVGLYQLFLERAGYVATIDWKATAVCAFMRWLAAVCRKLNTASLI